MRSFTLFEVALLLFISVLTFTITISFNSFNRNFFYLRDVAKNLSIALNTVSDFSQRLVSEISEGAEQFYCGAGIYFTTTSFEVLAFATTTKLCDDVMATSSSLNDFITTNLSPKKYILSNQDLTATQSPQSLLLNTTLKPGYRIIFSTTTNPTCNPAYEPPIIFMYIYSYSDLFFILKQQSTPESEWQKIDANEIYVCLEKIGGESYIIRLNKLGQLTIVK